jgi:hypothetical protein
MTLIRFAIGHWLILLGVVLALMVSPLVMYAIGMIVQHVQYHMVMHRDW